VTGRSGGTTALQPIPRVSLKDAIFERLGQLIDQEQIQPGARLPPELTLARALRVSRSSIRELQHLDDVIRRADQLFGEGFGPPAGADGTPKRVASAPVRASRTRKEDRKGHVGSNGRHR
jgi:DNA-binding transcriptional MocR family regulator